jgi:hypothetical protein
MKMKKTEIVWNEIYPTLGHLFYAVAFADGTVKTAEIKKLKRQSGNAGCRWKKQMMNLDQMVLINYFCI